MAISKEKHINYLLTEEKPNAMCAVFWTSENTEEKQYFYLPLGAYSVSNKDYCFTVKNKAGLVVFQTQPSTADYLMLLPAFVSLHMQGIVLFEVIK